MSLRYHLCLILIGVLAGCASQPSAVRPGQPVTLQALAPDDPNYATRHRILSTAERLLGVPYVLGGNTPKGIDCSGLVQYAYRQAGIHVPRTAAQLYHASKRLDYVMPGDLLFFRTGSPLISHVGIYAGGSQMIHASSSSHRVSKINLNQPYWRRHLAGGATFLAYR